jgi:hypothetical protein
MCIIRLPKPEMVALAQNDQPGSTIPATARSKRFCLILVKPSHYDEDGYVIQWFRSRLRRDYGVAGEV